MKKDLFSIKYNIFETKQKTVSAQAINKKLYKLIAFKKRNFNILLLFFCFFLYANYFYVAFYFTQSKNIYLYFLLVKTNKGSNVTYTKRLHSLLSLKINVLLEKRQKNARHNRKKRHSLWVNELKINFKKNNSIWFGKKKMLVLKENLVL